MKGKIVLVTGANGGLGSYVTEALLNAGATVVGVSRKIKQSDFDNPLFTALPGEISTPSGAKNVVDNIVRSCGRLDVVAHTVGGFAGGQSIADTDDATFQRMLDMNLNSTFYLLRAAIPRNAKNWWRTHHRYRQPCRIGTGRGCRSVQCIQGSHGFAD
jgi:NAD(P)-dependent dehydrogenase (short-subunit alcohol dehydrogenase family)